MAMREYSGNHVTSGDFSYSKRMEMLTNPVSVDWHGGMNEVIKDQHTK